MDARDFRGLGRAAQEALRRRALFLVEHEGVTQAQAAVAVGVRRQTVNVWLRRCRERGEGGVLDGRRVSPRRGEGRLTAEEAGKVRGWIAAGTPDRLELPFALRTSRAVRELVERRSGKRLGLSTVQLAFLRRLVRDAGRKVLLIVDDLRVRHAKEVEAWVASHAREVALFYLPAYAPEHDPDEYLNNDPKQALRQKPQPAAEEGLTESARSVLRAIQRSPRRVRACFKPQPVRHAA